jgi:hypothetical protein
LDAFTRKVGYIRERRRRRELCTMKLRSRKGWEGIEEDEKKEIEGIKRDMERTEKVQQRKIENLKVEEARFRAQHVLERKGEIEAFQDSMADLFEEEEEEETEDDEEDEDEDQDEGYYGSNGLDNEEQ